MSQHNFHFDDNGNLFVTGAGSVSTTVNQGNQGVTAQAWYVAITQGGNIAAVTAAGALKVDGSAVTQPTEDAADGIIGSPVVADAIQIGFKNGSGNLAIPSPSTPLPVTVVGQTTGNTPTFSISTGNSLLTVTSLVPVLSIQPQSGTQSHTFLLQAADLGGNGALVQYEVVRNASLTGASFTAVGGTSLMNYDVSATASSGGTVIDSGVFAFPRGKQYTTVGFNFTGSTGDIITLLLAGSGGSTVKVSGAFRWSEG